MTGKPSKDDYFEAQGRWTRSLVDHLHSQVRQVGDWELLTKTADEPPIERASPGDLIAQFRENEKADRPQEPALLESAYTLIRLGAFRRKPTLLERVSLRQSTSIARTWWTDKGTLVSYKVSNNYKEALWDAAVRGSFLDWFDEVAGQYAESSRPSQVAGRTWGDFVDSYRYSGDQSHLNADEWVDLLRLWLLFQGLPHDPNTLEMLWPSPDNFRNRNKASLYSGIGNLHIADDPSSRVQRALGIEVDSENSWVKHIMRLMENPVEEKYQDGDGILLSSERHILDNTRTRSWPFTPEDDLRLALAQSIRIQSIRHRKGEARSSLIWLPFGAVGLLAGVAGCSTFSEVQIGRLEVAGIFAGVAFIGGLIAVPTLVTSISDYVKVRSARKHLFELSKARYFIRRVLREGEHQ